MSGSGRGGGGRTGVGAWQRWLVGDDLARAVKRMRYAWLAGMIWAGIELFNAASGFFGLDTQGQPLWSVGQFAYVLAEALVIAVLSYGIKRRSRHAAIGLFCFFWISRIPLMVMGVIALGAPADFARFLVQVLLAYLFFQGMRGTLTFHYLTHPEYPDATSN